MTAHAGESSPLMTALILYSREREAAARMVRKQLGINELDTRALAFIGTNPGTRPSEMAAYLGVTSAGVTAMVERLVQRGILCREADELDRRVSHIHLGVDLEVEPWLQLGRFDESFRRLLEDLDPRVGERFAALLTQTTVAARSNADSIPASANKSTAA